MRMPSILAVAVMTALTLTGLSACSPTPTRSSAGEYIDDTTITTRVKLALANDPSVKASQVNVETYRGVVQLSGFVDSEANIKRAAEVARAVPGVQSVRNDLRIKPAR